MGSVIDFQDCPHCGSTESVYVDYHYRTCEESMYCMECGWSRWTSIKRDEQGNAILKKESFPVSECTLVVVEAETEENIWSMPLKDVDTLTVERIYDWLNQEWAPGEVPTGRRTVFHQDKQIVYYLTNVSIDGDTFIVEDPEWDEGESAPNGHIKVKYKNKPGEHLLSTKDNITKEEFLAEIERIKSDDSVEAVHASWFNGETKQLEKII